MEQKSTRKYVQLVVMLSFTKTAANTARTADIQNADKKSTRQRDIRQQVETHHMRLYFFNKHQIKVICQIKKHYISSASACRLVVFILQTSSCIKYFLVVLANLFCLC